jgi:hypothetical protein
MDRRFGTWTVRIMYRAGSLRAVGEEISICKLDLITGGTERAGEYRFFYRKGTDNHELGSGFLYMKNHISSWH